MPATVRAWANSETEGRNWLSFFRKVPASAPTIAGQWFDYSMAAGVPIPNYYASSPLVAARLEGREGIYIPEQTTKRRLKNAIIMSGSSSATSTANQNQTLTLLDYLLYYPFVDLDALEVQAMDNTVGLSRYEDGHRVQIMAVAQVPTVGGGRYVVNFIDDTGVERVTPEVYCPAAGPMGSLQSAVANASGITPFLPLGAGITGVRSIVSVTPTVSNGGRASFVLVKPFQMQYAREECRRPTSSPAESFGDATELERVRMLAGSEEIKPGAFVNWIGNGQAGSLASAPLVGCIETIWEA